MFSREVVVKVMTEGGESAAYFIPREKVRGDSVEVQSRRNDLSKKSKVKSAEFESYFLLSTQHFPLFLFVLEVLRPQVTSAVI